MFNRDSKSSSDMLGPAPRPQPDPQPTPQSPVQPVPPGQPAQPGLPPQPTQPQGISSGGAINPAAVNVSAKKHNSQLIETIILIVVSLIAATFIGLFVFMYIQWNNASTNLQGQIDAEVAKAVEVNTTKLQDEFTEKEKYPYEVFTGPEEYGSLF